jgi:uroporphyrinogen-III decarboxylase
VPLLDTLIDLGFDIINPVQINASGMDPQFLKDTFGSKITFWGGGIDTQKVLPLATPKEVGEQVHQLCDLFGANGGFVFNSIHNIQANVPVKNLIALMDTLSAIRG